MTGRAIGRDVPVDQVPATLGEDIRRAIDAIRPAIDAHQDALKQAVSSSAAAAADHGSGDLVG
jgi:hypothetical protein